MSGRRSAGAGRRWSPGVLLAAVLPVVALLALALVRPTLVPPSTATPPSSAALGQSSLSCPGATEGTPADQVGLGVASSAEPGSTGAVTLGVGETSTPVDLAPGPVVALGGGDTDAATVRATGDLAPGLLATRSVASPLAAVGCRPAVSEQWFSGVGAAAEHASILELANPEAGPAVAEVTVWSGTGAVDVPALRGLAVPAGTTTRVDLSQVVPRRGDLGLRVEVTRGRLGVAVLDALDPLTGAAPATDWLAPQPRPATSNLLLGLTRGAGTRTLNVTNPGDDAVEVTVSVITKRATFEPEGLEPIRVGPASTTTVTLDDLLAEASRRGAVGLRIESSGPVATALRQQTGRASTDLSLLTPTAALDEGTAAVLPGGRARLLLAGAERAGTVRVVASAADGSELSATQVDLGPDVAANVVVPAGAALVSVDPGDLAGQLHAAVLAQRPGATVLPLVEPQRTSRVPVVRPGLP